MEYVIQIFDAPAIGVRKLLSFVETGLTHIHDHFIPHHRNNYHPYVLRHGSLGLLSTALICFKIFVITLVSVGPIIPAFSSAITTNNIISLTNESRSGFSLAGLKENSELDTAAQTKANDMLSKGYFSHNTPDGKTPWDFISAVGYNYITAGENLAVNFTDAENVEQAWMNSPGHRANLLNKNYEEIGIGISQGTYQGHDAIFVVQMFGAQIDQKLTMLNQPTVVQPKPAGKQAVAPASTHKVSIAGVKQVKPATITIAQAEPAAVPVATELEITNPQISLQSSNVLITAKLSNNTVKAEATFGGQAIMLAPKADDQWQGQVDATKLTAGSLTVKLAAYDIAGKTKIVQLADFSSSVVDNYNPGATPEPKVSFLGSVFNPRTLESRVFLYFIAAMLASLLLAIGLKRHIQHLSLIANTSFVVMFACLLWMGG